MRFKGFPTRRYINFNGIEVRRSEYRAYARSRFVKRPHPLFEPNWYLATYLNNDAKMDPFEHYIRNAHTNDYDPNPYFCSRFYVDRYPESLDHSEGAFAHYLSIGRKKDYQPNILFDPSYYRCRYADIGSSAVDCLQHYVEYGAQEERSTHPLFEPRWYIMSHPEIAQSAVNSLHHYLRYGLIKGLNPHPLLDLNFIRSQLNAYQLGPDKILYNYIYNEEFFLLDPHPAFVAEYYYSSTRGSDRKANPLIEYLTVSSAYGKPNEIFDSNWYLNNYPDVFLLGTNPLVHYVTYGYEENRDPSDAFNTAFYIERNPDIVESKFEPMSHYIRHGKAEGRLPKASAQLIVGSVDSVKDIHVILSKKREDKFLLSSIKINYPECTGPLISIVIVLYNKSYLTLDCLRSIEHNVTFNKVPYELIIYDNNSADNTTKILDRVTNARIMKGNTNVGFLKAVNAAAEEARGKYILLLNNDTYVMAGAVEAAYELISSNNDIGAVGAKLILPNGVLQEAGSIVWSDGSCLGYLRDMPTESFEANFRRHVDYCSGAFLMIESSTFQALSGFEEIYQPAYYEETDFCVRLLELGLKVMYEPMAEILHFEFGSSDLARSALALQEQHREVFRERHVEFLSNKYSPANHNILRARNASSNVVNVLFIDDKVPHMSLGSGFPRSRSILNNLAELNVQITLFPTNDFQQSWHEVRKSIDPRIEVAFGFTAQQLNIFLDSRVNYYDLIIVSRPHNMEILNRIIEERPDLCGNAYICYDAEALFSSREIAQHQLLKGPLSDQVRADLISKEIAIARYASEVICVSDQEAEAFRQNGKSTRTIGHVLKTDPGDNLFEARKDILFVGGFLGEDTPNTDSIVWFIDEILPIIKRDLAEANLILVGVNRSSQIKQRLGRDVISLGIVDDIHRVYNQCRIFVAPTRFSAGIPHKVHEAAAAGIPCVVTSLLMKQLGWSNGLEVMSATTPEEFASACIEVYSTPKKWERLRRNALKAVANDCSEEKLKLELDCIMRNYRNRQI